MSVTADWLHNDPSTETVLIEFVEPWTFEEFSQSIVNELDPKLMSLPRKGYTITDLSRGAKLPTDALRQSTKIVGGEIKWEMTVVVGSTMFIKLFVNMLSRVIPRLSSSVAIANTIEEAEALINARRNKPAVS